jgi:hypothetical protein
MLELEAVRALIGKPGFGLLGDVGGMIIEHQLDRCAGRIGGVRSLRNSMNSRLRWRADRLVALIFVLVRRSMHAGLGRQIRGGRCDGPDTRLLIVRDNRNRIFPEAAVAFFKIFSWR